MPVNTLLMTALKMELIGSKVNTYTLELKGSQIGNQFVIICYKIAASSEDSENASKNRDIVAKRMTLNQIEKAQKLARECVRKKYKGC